MITDKLLECSRPGLEGKEITDLRIGLGYTAVELSSGEVGLAATLRYDLPRGCSLLEKAGDYTGLNAYNAGKLINKPDVLLSGIGLAAINAVTNQRLTSNAPFLIDALEIGPDDKVGMVGYFEPLIEEIRRRCGRLMIFEREASGEDYVYPDWAVNSLLPECDISILSSTTLINGTIDHLVDLSTGKIGLLGPSTPMCPPLAEYGINHLFGSIVTDPEQLFKTISQAGGTRNFGDSVKKINLVV